LAQNVRTTRTCSKTGIQPAANWKNTRRADAVPDDTGDEAMTKYDEGRLLRLLTTCVIAFLIVAACMFHYLPRQFAMIATCWAMLSISVGIGFGHAVLNEP
jgi:hypothetical protein